MPDTPKIKDEAFCIPSGLLYCSLNNSKILQSVMRFVKHIIKNVKLKNRFRADCRTFPGGLHC